MTDVMTVMMERMGGQLQIGSQYLGFERMAVHDRQRAAPRTQAQHPR
jgi:hypothetical protein